LALWQGGAAIQSGGVATDKGGATHQHPNNNNDRTFASAVDIPFAIDMDCCNINIILSFNSGIHDQETFSLLSSSVGEKDHGILKIDRRNEDRISRRYMLCS
jgi:hypothetical protein